MIERLIAGAIVSIAISVLGWKARALTGSGALAAMVVGTAVVVGTSWPGVLVLGTFFVSSSLLSKINKEASVAEKGSRRDPVQVLANGGVAAGGALLGLVVDERLGLALVASSLAAAAADTWATEIGSTSGRTPRLLVSRRAVQPGESGGVTARGTLASGAGALVVATIAGISGWVWISLESGLWIAAFAALGGFTGALADSIAGEIIQERRFCPACQMTTEARIHKCGAVTSLRSGVPGMTNDVVNVICTVTGAAIGLLILLV
jgi:uncharacterized protein (TIGR00297 family)